MILEQHVHVGKNVKEEDRMTFAKKAILDGIYKQLMDSDLIDIQEETNAEGGSDFYGGFIAYTQAQHNQLEKYVTIAKGKK